MSKQDQTLNIAEIMHPSGSVKFRYARYLNETGDAWIRHGLFVAYHESGTIASEVTYVHGQEHGECKDYWENGQLASSGSYVDGKEDGHWRFWTSAGVEEVGVIYDHGVEVGT